MALLLSSWAVIFDGHFVVIVKYVIAYVVDADEGVFNAGGFIESIPEGLLGEIEMH